MASPICRSPAPAQGREPLHPPRRHRLLARSRHHLAPQAVEGPGPTVPVVADQPLQDGEGVGRRCSPTHLDGAPRGDEEGRGSRGRHLPADLPFRVDAAGMAPEDLEHPLPIDDDRGVGLLEGGSPDVDVADVAAPGQRRQGTGGATLPDGRPRPDGRLPDHQRDEETQERVRPAGVGQYPGPVASEEPAQPESRKNLARVVNERERKEIPVRPFPAGNLQGTVKDRGSIGQPHDAGRLEPIRGRVRLLVAEPAPPGQHLRQDVPGQAGAQKPAEALPVGMFGGQPETGQADLRQRRSGGDRRSLSDLVGSGGADGLGHDALLGWWLVALPIILPPGRPARDGALLSCRSSLRRPSRRPESGCREGLRQNPQAPVHFPYSARKRFPDPFRSDFLKEVRSAERPTIGNAADV